MTEKFHPTADHFKACGFLLSLPTVYLFLSRLFALRRKRQSMIKLPCNKCNGCVSSSSHRLESVGTLIMQLCPALYLPVAATTSNRVRQMDRRNDTAPLNRKCDHSLRSPHWTHACALCLILIYFLPLFYAVGEVRPEIFFQIHKKMS